MLDLDGKWRLMLSSLRSCLYVLQLPLCVACTRLQPLSFSLCTESTDEELQDALCGFEECFSGFSPSCVKVRHPVFRCWSISADICSRRSAP
jgi:hypothetical protein